MSLYRRKDAKGPTKDHWWVRLRNPNSGRIIRQSTGTGDKREAQKIEDSLKVKLWGIKEDGKRLSDALVLWLKAKKRSKNDENMVRQIREMFDDNPLVQDITADLVLELLEDKNPGTYNRLANVIRSALNMAYKKKYMMHRPDIARKKEVEGRLRFLTEGEWLELLKHLPQHQKPMVVFSVATGVRLSNCTQLEWSQVSLSKRVAWIHADQAKGKKVLSLPLNDDAVAVLKHQLGKHDRWVFPYFGSARLKTPLDGRPIKSPKNGFNKAVALAKLTGVTWHTLRHTFASWHAMNGTPLPVLQKLGGWQDPKMVGRYAHLAPDYLVQFVGNARPVNLNGENEEAA
jgi:integrase